MKRYKKIFAEGTRDVSVHIWSNNHRKHYTAIKNLLKKKGILKSASYTSSKSAKHEYGGDHPVGVLEIVDETTSLPWDEIEKLAIKFDIDSDIYDDYQK